MRMQSYLGRTAGWWGMPVYMQHLRDNGTSISTALVPAATEWYLLDCVRTLLVQNEGHIFFLTMDLARLLLLQIGYVKRYNCKPQPRPTLNFQKVSSATEGFISPGNSFNCENSQLLQSWSPIWTRWVYTCTPVAGSSGWLEYGSGGKQERRDSWSWRQEAKKQLNLLVHSVENSSNVKSFTRAKSTAETLNIVYFSRWLSRSSHTKPLGQLEDCQTLVWENLCTICTVHVHVAHIRQEQKCPDQNSLPIMANFAAHSSRGVMQPLVEENGVCLLCFCPPTPLIDSCHSTLAQISINQTRTFSTTDSDTGMQSRFLWVFRVHQNVKLYQWTCELLFW